MPLSKNTIDNEKRKFKEDSNGDVAVNICGDQLQTIADAVSSNTNANVGQIEIAGQVISAIKAVKLNGSGKLIYSTQDVGTIEAQVLGISLNAGILDSTVNVITFGSVIDSSLSFSIDDDIYLSTTGDITDIPPLTGIYVKLGKMIKTNTLFVDIEQPIIL